MLGSLFARCLIFYHYLRNRYKTGTTVKNEKKLFIETYGCQMNVADSEVIGSILKVAGYEVCDKIEDADLILLNS